MVVWRDNERFRVCVAAFHAVMEDEGLVLDSCSRSLCEILALSMKQISFKLFTVNCCVKLSRVNLFRLVILYCVYVKSFWSSETHVWLKLPVFLFFM